MLTAGSCPSVGRDARRGVDSIVVHSNQTTRSWLWLLGVDTYMQSADTNILMDDDTNTAGAIHECC